MTLLSPANLHTENCQTFDCENQCKSGDNEKTNTNLSDCVFFKNYLHQIFKNISVCYKMELNTFACRPLSI
jgi:hypothetical protein